MYLFTLDSSGIYLKSNFVLLCSDFQLLFMGFATQFMVNGLSVYVKWATGRMSKNVTSTHRFPYITHICGTLSHRLIWINLTGKVRENWRCTALAQIGSLLKLFFSSPKKEECTLHYSALQKYSTLQYLKGTERLSKPLQSKTPQL